MAIHKVAVIQLYPKPLQPDDNHKRACQFIRDVASRGAVLAVLPEFHLTGWQPEDQAFALHAANYKSYLDSYCALAAELRISIVPGTIVEAHPSLTCSSSCPSCAPAGEKSSPSPFSPTRLLNIAHFISPTGSILGSYQKANLWEDERAHLSTVPATQSPHKVIQTPLGAVGLLACWDLAVPEAFRVLVAQGAKIIIVPAFWTGLGSSSAGLKRNPGFEQMILQGLVTARAFENTCAIVFTNIGGPEVAGDLGLSQVMMPFSGSVGKALGGGEGFDVIDVDMAELEEAEEFYGIRKDIAGDSWRYKLSDSTGSVQTAPVPPPS